MRIETLPTSGLDPELRTELRALLDRAFDDFEDHDWEHALGGHHVVAFDADRAVAHASVVHRPIDIGDRRFRTGYVEAVATDPDHQGRGAGRLVMLAAGDVIRTHHELGALCTGLDGYYERFGWERWPGRTAVRRAHRLEPTPEDDGLIFVLRHGPSLVIDLDPDAPISCDDRPGDVW